jgi:hypothetical protein
MDFSLVILPPFASQRAGIYFGQRPIYSGISDQATASGYAARMPGAVPITRRLGPSVWTGRALQAESDYSLILEPQPLNDSRATRNDDIPRNDSVGFPSKTLDRPARQDQKGLTNL